MAYENRSGPNRNRYGNRPSYGRSFERRMYPAKCYKCGNDCEVPFKPQVDEKGNPVRPVYCQKCFQEMKGKEHDETR